MRKSTFACIASMMFLFGSNSQLAQRKLYCHQRRASNKNASKDELLNFKIITSSCKHCYIRWFWSNYRKGSRFSVHQTTTIHSLKRTKSTDTDCSCAYRVVLWSVMTISAQNPFTRIQAKTLRINFCKWCFKRFNTVVT